MEVWTTSLSPMLRTDGGLVEKVDGIVADFLRELQGSQNLHREEGRGSCLVVSRGRSSDLLHVLALIEKLSQ